MRPGVALKPGTPIEEVYPLVYMPLFSNTLLSIIFTKYLGALESF